MKTRQVLLVDDDQEVAAALRQALADSDCELTTATTLARALEALGGGEVCLVVTEIEPRVPGSVLLGAARVGCPQLPVVVLTGLGDWASYGRALGMGACAFLNKPASPAQLRELVVQLCPGRIESEPVAA